MNKKILDQKKTYLINTKHDIEPKKINILEVNLDKIEFQGIESIIEEAHKVDVSNLSFNDIHHSFFSWCKRKSFNVSRGAIKTPNEIARFMVKSTLLSLDLEKHSVSWMDPCVGSGVFIEELLKMYIDLNKNTCISVLDLPKITVFDLSASGLFHCVLTIIKILSEHCITINEYINSGRMKFILDNTLNYQKEATDLIDVELEKFDAVIGNPPYIRSTRLSAHEKKCLKNNFPSVYSGSADIYFYFIASGISSLKDNGVISLITPANFMRSVSAKNLRAFILRNAMPIKIIDLDELPVFEDADIHTIIMKLRKNIGVDIGVKFKHLVDKREIKNINNMDISYDVIPTSNFNDTGWVTNTKSKINWSGSDFHTLKEAGFNVLSGIRPSYKQAFLYSQSFVDKLDIQVKSWFYPCIEGRDVTKWTVNIENNKFLLLISHDNCELPKELMSFLESHKHELLKRAPDRKKDKWFTLRQCSYYEEFNKTKIIFPDITSKSRFCIDQSDLIPMDGTFCIPTDSLVLLGILNSSLAWSYFQNNCSSIGNTSRSGRLRLKKYHVENFPLPNSINWVGEQAANIERTVIEIINHGECKILFDRLDRLVNELYS